MEGRQALKPERLSNRPVPTPAAAPRREGLDTQARAISMLPNLRLHGCPFRLRLPHDACDRVLLRGAAPHDIVVDGADDSHAVRVLRR